MIIVGNFLTKPVAEPEALIQPKEVKIFRVGQAPSITAQATIEKSGVVTIMAQTSGVIQKINFSEGQTLYKGRSLLSLSTNYSGSSLPGLQRQLAEKQHQFNLDNFDTQRDLIQKQKELAQKNDENNDQLRTLTEKSLSETKDQLSLNEDILSSIAENLVQLETATNAAQNQTTILATKQLKAQYLGVVNQLKSAIRSSEYQYDQDNSPAQMSDLQKDIALKQLDLQLKSLELSNQVSELNLSIARVSESLLYPTSPVTGEIERIYVKEGQLINPGQPLAMINSSSNQYKAIVDLPLDISKKIAPYQSSQLLVDDQIFNLVPSHISTEATSGHSSSVIYHLPEDLRGHYLSDGQILTIIIPLGFSDTTSSLPLIPIDAVHQLQDKSYVFTIKDGVAQSIEIKLGSVLGDVVEILSGLDDQAQIITNRNVISGDLVTVIN